VTIRRRAPQSVRRAALSGLAGALALVGWSRHGDAQSVIVRDSSSYVGKNRWNWRLFVQGAPKELAAIRCVTYELPSAFRDRERKVCKAGDSVRAFQVTGETVGSFDAQVRVEPRSGRSWRVTHTVAVVAPTQGPRRLAIIPRSVSTPTKSGPWDWVVFIEGPPSDLQLVRCVEYRHPTFYPPVRTVCDRGRPEQPFALAARAWEEFDIGVRLILMNGSVQDATHHVRLRQNGQ
jgi:transcription initiation factor IIF auxiliary subunit